MKRIANFKLVSDFEPKGDQPQAVEKLTRGLEEGHAHQVLLGVTGSGKTFTMANVIAHYGRPTLIISHNKTLAAQLYSEFREFFPHNAAHYFVSYYDYYQPEAYIPQKDIYIEKDASINDDIDRLRLAATSALMSRKDVIIVASVSCIYGLGSPSDYKEMMVDLQAGGTYERDEVLRKLVDIRYERNDIDFTRGRFRVRGDTIEIFPAYEGLALRVELFGNQIDQIAEIDPLTGEVVNRLNQVFVYPAKHFVLPDGTLERALESIEAELEDRLRELRAQGKLLEAQRLEARTRYDLEMLREVGYCAGIENYSRHLSGRPPGSRPYTLIDYFGDDFLTIVDESHATIPQIHGMYNGDRSRKETLVEHGFRLPSALDNRPLRFGEWAKLVKNVIYVSATPGPYELKKSGGEVVEQLIRPTGLVDPVIRVESARNQVEHLMGEIRKRVARKERVLVTTLTKRLAEQLSEYFKEEGIKGEYLHSEIQTIQRVEILRDLRLGRFDVVVGVNLLREGLDLPEVSLVAILDADKEGFLRSETSLIQTIGRTARNINAEVVLYADTITESMKRAIDETNRRRRVQLEHNEEHGVKPQTIRKAIRKGIEEEITSQRKVLEVVNWGEEERVAGEQVREFEEEMYAAADRLDFEEAARLRDIILRLQGSQKDRKYDFLKLFPKRRARRKAKA